MGSIKERKWKKKATMYFKRQKFYTKKTLAYCSVCIKCPLKFQLSNLWLTRFNLPYCLATMTLVPFIVGDWNKQNLRNYLLLYILVNFNNALTQDLLNASIKVFTVSSLHEIYHVCNASSSPYEWDFGSFFIFAEKSADENVKLQIKYVKNQVESARMVCI